MGSFFCKLFTPWRAEALFPDEDAFFGFLLRRNKVLNGFRVLLFAIAALCLIASYALDLAKFNYYAAAALVLALGLSLLIMQNEKALPEELRAK